MPTYRYRDGQQIKGVAAEHTYEELMRITDKNEGVLSPRAIVDESKPADAVLHPAFEWNNARAADSWRLHQARQIARSVYIVEPATDEAPKQEAPAFFHIQRSEYRPTEQVIRRPDLFEQAIEQLHQKFAAAERAIKELERAAEGTADHDRLAAIALAVQGFEAVRQALAIIR